MAGSFHVVLSVTLLLVASPSLAVPRTGQASVSVVVDATWPVQFTFAPDGRMFFNELFTGQVRIFSDGVARLEPFLDVADHVAQRGERFGNTEDTANPLGLLGIALHPDFETQAWVYVYYSYVDRNGTPLNRVERFLETDGRAGPSEVLLEDIPYGNNHNGGILDFGPDRMLYVTTGDAWDRPSIAQDLASPAGKVLRLAPDGSIPEDNPFPASPVFTLGHRNVFGLTFHPTLGTPFVSENGPAEPDELNRIVPGGNYGWPEVVGIANDPRYVDPIAEFGHHGAPTGLTFYTGDRLPEWRGSLFMGNLRYGQLFRFRLNNAGDRVVSQTLVFDGEVRILDLEDAPDGFLYFSTPNSIYRIDRSGASFEEHLFFIGAAALVVGVGISPLLLIMLWDRIRKK